MNSSSGLVDDLTPAVDPLDLQRVFTMMSVVHAMSVAHGKGPGMIDMGIYKKMCGPEADVNAVWYRANILLTLCQGPLAGSLEGKREKVIEVAAKFPMKRMEPGVQHKVFVDVFDVPEFLKQIEQPLE